MLMNNSQRIQSAIIHHEVTQCGTPLAKVADQLLVSRYEAAHLLQQYSDSFKEYYFPIEQYSAMRCKCRNLLARISKNVSEKKLKSLARSTRVIEYAFHMPITGREKMLFEQIRSQVLADTYLPASYRNPKQHRAIVHNKSKYE